MIYWLLLALLFSKGTYRPNIFPYEMDFKKDFLRLIIIILEIGVPSIIIIILLGAFKAYPVLLYFGYSHLFAGLVSAILIIGIPRTYQYFHLDYPGDLLRKRILEESKIEIEL
jgi:hypothetical protein